MVSAATRTSATLSVEGLHMSYGADEVLKGVDLNVNSGDVTTFIGPSGTGKTTLLKCINYLERPTAGRVVLDGTTVDYGQKVNGRDVTELRKKTAMVFQHFNIFKHRTVLQNVTDPLTIVHGYGKAEAEEIAATCIRRVGLADKTKSYPAMLSGGQLQRVGIARALAVNPTIILFDEPTSSLDPELVSGILDIIADLATTGMTILLVTHEMQFAKTVSTNIVFMEHGHVVEEGTPDQVFNHPTEDRTREFIASSRHE